MNIASEFIKSYLFKKFENKYKLSSNDEEFIINSVFVPDYKYHMAINLKTGLWQDFKSKEKGNFISLYSYLEKKTYSNAEADLTLKSFEFSNKENYTNVSPIKFDSVTEQMGEVICFNIKDPLPNEYTSTIVDLGYKYIQKRKLNGNFCVCVDGKFKNRLIIPYRHQNNEIFFFQARSLTDSKPKYLNCTGVKSSHIIYPSPDISDYIVVCEGPLDSESLIQSGVQATSTQGCVVSHLQLQELKNLNKKIIIGYDNDAAGNKGVKAFKKLSLIHRIKDVYICKPPKEYKDWNAAYIKGFNLLEYIESTYCKYDFNYEIKLNLNT